MRTWIIGIFLCLIPPPTQASAGDILSDFQKNLVEIQVHEFFAVEDPHGGNIEPLSRLTPRPPIIELLMKELRARARAGMNRNNFIRAEKFMALIHDLASRSEMPTEEFRPRLQRVAHDLLVHFQDPGEIRTSLLEIFDRFDLWSWRDIWFFERIHSTHELTEQIHHLRQLMRKISTHDTRGIAQTLRSLKPTDLTALALLLETGHMTEAELVTMLRIASIQFAVTLYRGSPDEDNEHFEHRLGDARARLVAGKLRAIMRQLSEEDPIVSSAFTKAFVQAQLSKTTRYHHDDRLHFFTLLQENRLDWYNRASWRTEVREIAKKHIPLRERYRVEGNMILVNFRNQICEEDL